jgi:multimeric flavodoxin WrbA
MAKKVLILSSSPRRGGNSDTLCDEFMRGAAESNHEVEKIFLRDKTIHYCTGCSTCSLYQKPCPQKDDAAEIIEKMVDADVIVMATPVYFYTISAQMKTLIDRCCGRYTEMNGKEFYFIVTAAEDDRKKMLRTIDFPGIPGLPGRSRNKRNRVRIRRLAQRRDQRKSRHERCLSNGKTGLSDCNDSPFQSIYVLNAKHICFVFKTPVF